MESLILNYLILDDLYLFGQFIWVIKQFWENGEGLGLFDDNAPFNYQINVLIEELFPDSKFRIAGNHLGGKILYGDETGHLNNNSTFKRKILLFDNYHKPPISFNLNSKYEGTTISYFVEKPNDGNLLYFGDNEELKMITDPKLLISFVPFSKDSDGGFNLALFYSNDDKGDIIIDCSFSKFFLEMKKKWDSKRMFIKSVNLIFVTKIWQNLNATLLNFTILWHKLE